MVGVTSVLSKIWVVTLDMILSSCSSFEVLVPLGGIETLPIEKVI